MKTPPLLEAFFQIDARAGAKTVCAAWNTLRDQADCMERLYPHALATPTGAAIIQFCAFLLVLAAVAGFCRGLVAVREVSDKCAVWGPDEMYAMIALAVTYIPGYVWVTVRVIAIAMIFIVLFQIAVM